MQPSTVDMIREQVRTIYRAVTGTDMPEPDEKAISTASPITLEEVARRFADLEALASAIPAVIERVPPFSFAPAIDAIVDERELLIEVAVPSIQVEDVKVERSGELLVISGVRSGERATNGRTCVHAEIPRGPFHRVLRLPFAVGEPRVEVDKGLIRIHLSKARAPAQA